MTGQFFWPDLLISHHWWSRFVFKSICSIHITSTYMKELRYTLICIYTLHILPQRERGCTVIITQRADLYWVEGRLAIQAWDSECQDLKRFGIDLYHNVPVFVISSILFSLQVVWWRGILKSLSLFGCIFGSGRKFRDTRFLWWPKSHANGILELANKFQVWESLAAGFPTLAKHQRALWHTLAGSRPVGRCSRTTYWGLSENGLGPSCGVLMCPFFGWHGSQMFTK